MFHRRMEHIAGARLGDDQVIVDALPDRAVESFAGVGNPLRPGGRLQFADIANGRPVPADAMRDVDLWTG